MSWKKIAILAGICVVVFGLPIYLITPSGLETLHGWVDTHQDSEFARNLQYKIGQVYFGYDNMDRAERHLTYYLDQWPNGEKADLAMYYRALALFDLERQPEAVDQMEQFLVTYPEHELRAQAENTFQSQPWRRYHFR